MDIKIYNKQHQAKLDFPCMRLEFYFKGGSYRLYTKDLLIKTSTKPYKMVAS